MNKVFSLLKHPKHFLERHALFVQANHVMREYHPGGILLTNQTPFDLWQPAILHALYHAITLLKCLLLSCTEEDFQGWMFEFRLPPKACERLGIRSGSIDQVITFWRALFSIRLFVLCDSLTSLPSSEWSPTMLSPAVYLQDVVLFMKAKPKWWARLAEWDALVQSGKCRLSTLQ